jgi:hypothetical protein
VNQLITCLFLFPFLLVAQKKVNPETELKQQQKDFAAFMLGLNVIESKLDRHVSMDSIQKVLLAAEKRFKTEVLTAIDEFKIYARCVDLIESGHTQAFPSKKVLTEYYKKGKSLPFDMVMVNKHLYVNGYAPEKPNAKNKRNKSEDLVKGTEIIAIDGKSIAEWMVLIGEYIGSDEDDPGFEYTVAGQLFDFYRFIVTEKHTNRLQLDLVLKNDTLRESVRLTYPPLKYTQTRFKGAKKEHKKDVRTPGKFKLIGDTAAVFTFKTFEEADGFRYSEFLKKSFKKIKKKKKLTTLVIDVRGNGGGTIQTELMGYLLNKPQEIGTYQIAKKLKRADRKYLKKNDKFYRLYRQNVTKYKRFQKKHPQFKGQLFSHPIDTSLIYRKNIIVLTDEATFSAASLLACQLKTLRNAQLMGARAGGSFYVFNAGSLTYVLPHSGIQFILNPHVCRSTLADAAIDETVKDVDVEIVPDYDPKASAYKKSWEAVVKTALTHAKH